MEKYLFQLRGDTMNIQKEIRNLGRFTKESGFIISRSLKSIARKIK